MTDEDTVWYYTWKRLVAAGIAVIGGEPPGGSSPLPRIEMKHPGKTSKGSRGSRKCDLYATHHGRLMLIEAKDSHSKIQADVEKLADIIENSDWAGALWDALDERRLAIKHGFPNRDIFISDRFSLLAPIIAIPPEASYRPPTDFLLIETDETATTLRCADDSPSTDIVHAIEAFLEATS